MGYIITDGWEVQRGMPNAECRVKGGHPVFHSAFGIWQSAFGIRSYPGPAF